MPLDAGSYVRVQMLGRCFGQRIITDYGYRVTVGNAAPILNCLIDIAETARGPGALTLWGTLQPALPPQYTLEQVRAQMILPTRSASVDFTPVAGTVGTNAGPATVACDSASVIRRTNRAGRNQVSVLKIGPCPDGASAAGALTDAYKVLLATHAQISVNLMVTLTLAMQLVPCIIPKVFGDPERDLNNWRIGSFSRVMYRRIVGVGE